MVSSSSHRPILCVGDLVADIVITIKAFPVLAAQHQTAEDGTVEPGGGGNFLIAGARLGWPMAVVGSLGADVWGPHLLSLLQAEGVETSAVRLEGNTTLVVALSSGAGEHVYIGVQAENEPLMVTDEDRARARAAGAIFCFGYTLAETNLRELAFTLMQEGREAGVPVYFDPGPLLARVPMEERHRALALSDTVLLTEDEVPLLAATPEALLELGPTLVVLKRGAEGCQLITSEGRTNVPGYPVEVVDTSAAGDSFAAAFLVGRLRGWSLVDAARLANAMGAAKVQKIGSGRNVPTRDEVRAVLQRFDVNLDI